MLDAPRELSQNSYGRNAQTMLLWVGVWRVDGIIDVSGDVMLLRLPSMFVLVRWLDDLVVILATACFVCDAILLVLYHSN